MNDEKIMKVFRLTTIGVSLILMIITVVLQTVAFEALRHTILCSCVLLLITVTLIFDGILKDSKRMALHGSWYALWFFNLIRSLFEF